MPQLPGIVKWLFITSGRYNKTYATTLCLHTIEGLLKPTRPERDYINLKVTCNLRGQIATVSCWTLRQCFNSIMLKKLKAMEILRSFHSTGRQLVVICSVTRVSGLSRPYSDLILGLLNGSHLQLTCLRFRKHRSQNWRQGSGMGGRNEEERRWEEESG
jgi:hypothetical protein